MTRCAGRSTRRPVCTRSPGRILDVHASHFVGARPTAWSRTTTAIHLIFAAELLPEVRWAGTAGGRGGRLDRPGGLGADLSEAERPRAAQRGTLCRSPLSTRTDRIAPARSSRRPDPPAAPRRVFTYGAPPLKFGDGASTRSATTSRRTACGGSWSSPTPASPRPATRNARRPDRRRSASRRGCTTGRTSSRPTRAWRRRSRSPATPGRGRARRRRRRVGDRHREGGRPALHQPRRLIDYVNAPIGGGRRRSTRCARWSPCPPRPARAPRAPRCASSTCSSRRVKSRHQPPAAAAHAGRRRPGADPQPARRGHRGVRHGHPVPRTGELDGAPLHLLRPEGSREAGALLRRQPGRRHVVGAGDDAARHALPAGRPARRRRAGARARWRWPRRSPESGSATPACTSRMPTPTRSPARSRTSGRPATRPTSRWCRTAWRSR